jgi:hypothetical protein
MAGRRGRGWSSAVVVASLLGVAAGCGSSGSESPAQAAGPGLPRSHLVALAKPEAPLRADVVRRPGGKASMAGATLMIEPSGGSALVSFDVAAVDPDCVGSAVLRVPALQASVPVLAYVSLETEVADLPNGADLGAVVVAANSPRERSVVEGSGLRWDVGDLLTWNDSYQHHPPALVFALKPEWTADPTPVELGASESGQGAILTVTYLAKCSKPG